MDFYIIVALVQWVIGRQNSEFDLQKREDSNYQLNRQPEFTINVCGFNSPLLAVGRFMTVWDLLIAYN